ncbi:hypothetical protein [uncultured Ruegeria sp.]|uniref:hypothetical protein n=1 Tax=uncultured Ruegeria sp. TaxID=259304 RepID=UPI0026031598|nr:hypothetical protein [uncultured Ruegeria sp.]
MLKINGWHKGSVSTLNRYLSGTGGHKITSQTLGLIGQALEWSDEDMNWVLYGESAPTIILRHDIDRIVEAIQSAHSAEQQERSIKGLASLYLATLWGGNLAGQIHHFDRTRSDEEVVNVLFQFIGTTIVSSFEFEDTEDWSIVVYRASITDETAIELVPIAHISDPEKPLESIPSMRPGEGLIGRCFNENNEVSSDQVGSIQRSGVSGETSTSEVNDNWLWRSAFACPVFLESQDLAPWGVVAAASSNEERFLGEGGIPKEAVRAISNMTANIISANSE